MENEFKATIELEHDKKDREEMLEKYNVMLETMNLGISEKVQTQMAKLCSRRIDVDDVRMLKLQLDILLKAYDSEALMVKLCKEQIEKINDELAKRAKEKAGRDRVAELRAQADALEKRIEVANEDETI